MFQGTNPTFDCKISRKPATSRNREGE